MANTPEVSKGLSFACSSDGNPLKKEQICKSLYFTGVFNTLDSHHFLREPK